MNYLLSLLFLSFPLFCIAQSSITGKVLDQTKHPVGDVQILNLSSSHHAHSNEYGTFSIQDSKIGDTLKFYHMGYNMLEVVVDKKEMG